MLVIATLLAVGVGLAWWVIHRAARMRREAQEREARVLDALFAARRGGDGSAAVNLDRVLGAMPTGADAAPGAAGLQADLIALLASRAPAAAAAPGTATEAPARVTVGHVTSNEASANELSGADQPAGLVPVRDLVQVFYEGRGFRTYPADPSVLPIELVLTHKSDPHRSYAFAPLSGAPSDAEVRSIVENARRIDQRRVLMASEAALPGEQGTGMSAQGVRVFDRGSIEEQLSRLDPAIASRIRAAAGRRASYRQRGG